MRRRRCKARLVKAVYPPEQLLAEARRLARRIVDNRSPVAIALARQMMYRNFAQSQPVAAHRIDWLAMFYTSIGDGKEGVRSFLEKRDPAFQSAVGRNLPPFYAEWARSPE
ncbi:MAG TPA: enoyl-CoA hydratase-related protein [Steroidobacter sp.]